MTSKSWYFDTNGEVISGARELVMRSNTVYTACAMPQHGSCLDSDGDSSDMLPTSITLRL